MTVNKDQVSKIVGNKWFKVSKFSLVALLVITSILALVGAWYVNRTVDGSTIKWVTSHTTAQHMFYYHSASTVYYALLLVFGILGIAFTFAILGSRTKLFTLVGLPITAVLVIVNILIISLGIHDTGAEVVYGLLAA